MAKVIHYIRFTAIGFDQFINTLLGGYPDETNAIISEYI